MLDFGKVRILDPGGLLGPDPVLLLFPDTLLVSTLVLSRRLMGFVGLMIVWMNKPKKLITPQNISGIIDTRNIDRCSMTFPFELIYGMARSLNVSMREVSSLGISLVLRPRSKGGCKMPLWL